MEDKAEGGTPEHAGDSTQHVVCTLPNAADVINGYIFVEVGDVKVSEPLDEEAFNRFVSIEGYHAYEGDLGTVFEALQERHYALAEAAQAADVDLVRQVRELQTNLDLTHEKLQQVQLENEELRAANADQKKQLDIPSDKWSKAQLLKFAEDRGLTVANAMTKAELVDLIGEDLIKSQ